MTAPVQRFKVGQTVNLRGFLCGCSHQHGEQVSFRGYDWVWPEAAEVFSCRGSVIVSVELLSAADGDVS